RAGLVAGAGGLLTALGVLLPWQVVGSILLRSSSGLSRPAGWAVLAGAIATIVAGVLIVMVPRDLLRRTMVLLIATAAVLAALVATNAVVGSARQTDQAIRDGIVQVTGRAPAPA